MPQVAKKPGRNKIHDSLPQGYKFCRKCETAKLFSEFDSQPTSIKASAAKSYAKHGAKYIERRKSKIASLPEDEQKLLRKKQHEWNKIRKYQDRGASGKHTLKQWEELKVKCGNKCKHCGKGEPAISLTRDHIVPISKGGTNDISNIQPLCKSCNSKKGASE